MTGGATGNSSISVNLDTSEVYDSDLGSWVTSGAKLPQPMSGLRATNIDGRVLIFGNISLYYTTFTQIIIAGGQGWIYDDQNHYYDDILEFNPVENALVPLGPLMRNDIA